MYQVLCDNYPIMDFRDERLILENPNVSLEINTVGGCSFTIYNDHPYYDKLNRMKSVFEVIDDLGVIFRGRMTNDTRDFNNGKAVDLEGAMAFFNDSVVRPFNFPGDFSTNSEYIAAAESGNVIEFFLKWLIDNHNAQVQEFQRLKLGRVTVTDPNNYISRSNSDYANTWETLKSKLFDSALGGFLCPRYEDDGTYIDYLAEAELLNAQEVEFGANILDLSNEMDGTEVFSAVLPLGKADEETKKPLTISSLPNKDIDSDIVKTGDIIYSRKAVEAHGWICKPVKWDDVTVPANLQSKAVKALVSGMLFANTIEVTAVDLHFSDSQIQSFRICRNVRVNSAPHGISDIYLLSKLEIPLLEPQNTKITVGNTKLTMTSATDKKIQDITQSAKNEMQEYVSSTENRLNNKIDGIEGTYFYIKYSAYSDGHIMTNVPQDDTAYMGVYSGSAADGEAPTDYRLYTWSQIRGADGLPGENGKDGYTPIKGIDFFDGQPGKDGQDGKDGYTPQKGVDYFDGLPGKDGKDGLPGERGLQGLPGNDGKDGSDGKDGYTPIKGVDYFDGKPGADGKSQYLHIKYSDDGKTFTANGGETLGAYIGTLVDFTEADSTNFSDYTWKKFTEDVDEELNDIRQSVSEQHTSIINDCQSIIMSALETYTETSNFEQFKQTVESELKLLNDELTLKFSETETKIQNVDGDLQSKFNSITKYFTFDINGMTIGQTDSPYKMVLDNDRFSMMVNGVEVMWIANGEVHTPDLSITKSFKIFDYLISLDNAGNVNGEYVGV
jgi:hypothetical protein